MAWPAMPTYSAAKAGMITYTRSAGHPLEHQIHGVRFICLCPGAVDTPMQVNANCKLKPNSYHRFLEPLISMDWQIS